MRRSYRAARRHHRRLQKKTSEIAFRCVFATRARSIVAGRAKIPPLWARAELESKKSLIITVTELYKFNNETLKALFYSRFGLEPTA